MYIVGVRNNEYHNFKIIFQSRFKTLTKIVSLVVKPFYNETEINNTKNIKLTNNI